MKSECTLHEVNFEALPRMPSWVTSARAETLEDVAFLSGSALAHLHLVLNRDEMPKILLRERLALRAAEACVALSGHPERAGDLRDAVHLMRAGDRPGPAGEVYLCWRRAIERPLSIKALHRALPMHAAEEIALWLDAGAGAPVTRAAQVLEIILNETPRTEMPGLILAEAALSQALGWKCMTPLLSVGLKHGDLCKRGDDLRLACHRAVIGSIADAVRMASDLARRTALLNAVAPQLRARGAGAAVKMFLTLDAVTPAALTTLNSDRAARRFCDRLVELNVARELTGRETFRLYGV